MTEDFFYIPPDKMETNRITLDGDEFRHAVKVLRKKKGELIYATDGTGFQYQIQLSEISKHSAAGTVLKKEFVNREMPLELTLAVGIIKGERMDWFLEKGVELGIKKIIPLTAKFSVVKTGKPERWKQILIAAMKQCQRTFLPELSPVTSFKDLVENSSEYDLRLIAHEKEEDRTLLSVLRDQNMMPKKVLAVVGPEGGFAPEEIYQAVSHQFIPISLGPRRLRTETAALAIPSILSLFYH